ncbi:MAG: hypothetical protein VW338_00295 [Rhodospirillaceae bacterium]
MVPIGTFLLAEDIHEMPVNIETSALGPAIGARHRFDRRRRGAAFNG